SPCKRRTPALQGPSGFFAEPPRRGPAPDHCRETGRKRTHRRLRRAPRRLPPAGSAPAFPPRVDGPVSVRSVRGGNRACERHARSGAGRAARPIGWTAGGGRLTLGLSIHGRGRHVGAATAVGALGAGSGGAPVVPRAQILVRRS